ncbi:MAG: hypothetical protein ACRERU_10020 [Methylococcales bacterium]
MNQTKSDRSARLAGVLFDEVLVPLAAARRARGAQPYFPLQPDPKASSYFSPPSLRTPSDFELRGGTAEGLLEALAALWEAQGETELAAMIPRMKEIAEALADEHAESDGTVDVLCYTLF